MAYAVGALVEITRKIDAFQGSFHLAKIKSILRNCRYMIEYQTILLDSGWLSEVVVEDQIRPAPLKLVVEKFEVGQTVDAFISTGWWTGKISKVIREEYVVKFRTPPFERWVNHEFLRLHQFRFQEGWLYFDN